MLSHLVSGADRKRLLRGTAEVGHPQAKVVPKHSERRLEKHHARPPGIGTKCQCLLRHAAEGSVTTRIEMKDAANPSGCHMPERKEHIWIQRPWLTVAAAKLVIASTASEACRLF